MPEMIIDSIRVSLMNYQRVVILRQKDTNRYLPIWIGPSEADAIAVKLQDVSVPRPLTHDLLGSIIDALGATVNHIVVSDLSDDTFYAKVVLNSNGSSTEVDCRPSDAIALAVRAKAPIYAETSVLDKAGVEMDGESGKDLIQGKKGEQLQPVGEEELKGLSAYNEFISTLNLDDLGETSQEKPGSEESGQGETGHQENPPSDGGGESS